MGLTDSMWEISGNISWMSVPKIIVIDINVMRQGSQHQPLIKVILRFMAMVRTKSENIGNL